MRQLGTLDSAFINLEQTDTPQHVGGLGLYDPSTAPGGSVRFKQVIATFQRRLNSQPLFRTRLVEVPGGVDRPYWVKDANFDVEFHLRHIALPQPGDWRQLCIQVARLHARALDFSRPLWEAYIIEGLDNIPHLPPGCFAIYTKIHHSLVDGAGGQSFMNLLHDREPEPGTVPVDEGGPRLVDSAPTASELLARASVNSVKHSLGLAAGTVRNARAMGGYLLDVARHRVPTPALAAPRTLFNGPVGPHRVFDAVQFPLDGFREIGSAGGGRVNDVALAVISGALRRFLEARGELPSAPLVAGIPLDLRTRREVSDENNQVGVVFCSLHTDEADPVRRLQAIRESSDAAKQAGEANPLVDVLRLAGAVSPLLARSVAGIWSRNELGRRLPPSLSTVVSNVAGPGFPLYCAGARLVEYYGMGLLTPGMGLFHMVYSYAGKVTLSVLADRDALPDPLPYRDCLAQSYEALRAATVPSAAARRSRGKVRPTGARPGRAAARRAGALRATRRKGASAVPKLKS